MNILYSTNTYNNRLGNVGFGASRGLESFFKQARALGVQNSDPKERERDIFLGTEIQSLRKKSLLAQRSANKETNLALKQQKLALAEQAKTQKESLVKELVERHLRLAFTFAQDYRNRSSRNIFEDIVSYASLGLLKAAERYNPTNNKNVAFPTYAKFWAKSSIDRNLNQDTQIYIPLQTRRKHHKLKQAKEKLTQELGREPSVQELTNKLGRKHVHAVKELIDSNISEVSMDNVLYEDSARTLGDTLPDPRCISPSDKIEKKEIRTIFKKLMDGPTLTPQEKRILSARYKIGAKNATLEDVTPLRELAQEFNVSAERIRQIENIAINKLKIATKHLF